MNLFYFGSDQFSNFALKAIIKKQNLFKKITVCTKRNVDNTKELIKLSKENNFEIFDEFSNNKIQNKNSFQKLQDLSNQHEKKLMIACSFGLMVPNKLIDNFDQNCFVVHPSLLPNLRGSSPISGAFLAGLKTTGVTIVEMSKNQYDAGQIFLQKKLQIQQEDKYPQLFEKLGNLSNELLQEFLEQYVDGQQFFIQKQILQTTSYAKKLKQGDNYISFKEESGKQIMKKHKAYFGSTLKGIRIIQETKQLRIIDCEFFQKNLKEILNLDYNIDQYIEIGNSVQGLGKKKHTLFIKCSDGYLWVKNAIYLNKPNLDFTLTYINFISDELKGRLSKFNVKDEKIFKNIKLLRFTQIIFFIKFNHSFFISSNSLKSFNKSLLK